LYFYSNLSIFSLSHSLSLSLCLSLTVSLSLTIHLYPAVKERSGRFIVEEQSKFKTKEINLEDKKTKTAAATPETAAASLSCLNI